MRPFSTSANAQTASSVAVVSMKVNSRKIMRYARMAVMLWNKYWKHFSPEYAQPKIVEDAKNNRPIVIKYGPISPSNTPNAEAVSTPASIDPSCHRPDITIVIPVRSEEHTSELQSRFDLVCRLLLEKKNHELDITHI